MLQMIREYCGPAIILLVDIQDFLLACRFTAAAKNVALSVVELATDHDVCGEEKERSESVVIRPCDGGSRDCSGIRRRARPRRRPRACCLVTVTVYSLDLCTHPQLPSVTHSTDTL